MLNPFTKWFSNSWYFIKGFFPIQLLLLHLRRSYIVMIFWIILFLFISAKLGASYGFQYLFLSPEYLNEVSFWSYFLVGVMAGLFVMAFHISSYIYYSYRYPFLATLNRPLYKFCINNSIIPLAFYTVYIVLIVQMLSSDGKSLMLMFSAVSGLLLGSIITVGLTLGYFFTTIKSVEPQSGPASRALDQIVNKKQAEKRLVTGRKAVVNHYLKNFITIKLTRDVDHYNKQRLLDTIQSHHTSAFFYFLLLIILVVAANLSSSIAHLRIPAGASVFLIFSLYLMITGAVYTRFKTWTLSLGILAVIGINYLSGLPDFKGTHYAYGLDYNAPKAAYTYENLETLTSDSIVAFDKREAEAVLNRWKTQTGRAKPKLVLLNASGGGLRSSLFTLSVLQTLDSTLGEAFYPNLHLIAGSSGGMLGASYYRQLKYESRSKANLDPNGAQHLHNMGQDLLNPIAFNLAVNDLFWRWRTFEYRNRSYLIDRGKAFDDKLEENTMGLLSGAFGDWREAEYQAQMPMMVLAPTVIGDGRKLLMSNLGISFLTYSEPPPGISLKREYDAVEYSRLFQGQAYEDLRFTTALRLSASFPYITPLVHMPSSPTIELIDAGARDNEGFELGLRYVLKMKDWIAENTSGVVVVQIKANRPDEVPIEEPDYSRLSQIAKPFGGIVRSFSNLQIYNKALLMELSADNLDFPVDLVRYSLFASEDELSLSWHLAEREKAYIKEAMGFERNQKALDRLREILKP